MQRAHIIRAEGVDSDSRMRGLCLQGKGGGIDGYAFKKRDGLGGSVVPADAAQFCVEKRRVIHRPLKSGIANRLEDALRRAGFLDFQHQTSRPAEAGAALDQLQNLGKRRNRLSTGDGAQLPDFLERFVAHKTMSGGGGLQEEIMQEDEVPIPRSLDVDFDQIHADAQSRFDGGQGVAGGHGAGSAAVPDAQLMKDSEGVSTHPGIMMHCGSADLARNGACREAWSWRELTRLEGWYRKHCPPAAEVCLVPLPGGSSGAGHLHAVLVPDFSLLKERRQANTRELLRFEFQKASLGLAAAERPHSFCVRAKPLPRLPDGEPDRERLRKELGEVESHAAALDSGSRPGHMDPVAACVYGVIRAFRPGARVHEEDNLELDLDFDSLDRLQLIASVEKALDVSIAAGQAARIFTVGDLMGAIAPRSSKAEPRRGAESLPVSWAEILDRPLGRQERALAGSILKPRPALSFVAWGAARLLRALWGRRFQFRVEGMERLPRRGAYLLIANHCSHLDPLFLLWALPFSAARRVSFMGHTEYFGSGWKAAIARRLKLVPVDPDEHAMEGIRLCAEALRRGFIGAVFPEGERSPDGAQQRFHRGIALLAMHLHLPIVPMAIAGTYEVFPRGGDRIRSSPVQVRLGEPLLAGREETEQDLLARAWAAVWRLRDRDARSRERIPRPLDICPARLL